MKFINTALKFLVAIEASMCIRSGVRAQSVVGDRTSENNGDNVGRFSSNGINNLRVVVDPETRGDGSSSTTGTSDVTSDTLPADSGGRNGHYSVDDLIRKQEEVAAFEETFRKVDALIKKGRRGGGYSSPLQESDSEAKGDNRRAKQMTRSEEAPRKLKPGKLNSKISKISKSSSKVDNLSSLRKELNLCLARTESLETEADQCQTHVESLETEIDKTKNDKNEEKMLYVQESESCEVTRKKKRDGKTVWKIVSTNLNRITFRYTSIPYRLAWKEPSYLFSWRFPSVFPDDGPNAVLTSGDKTVVFYINKVEYEFDEETKTAKQVFEIEQSEVHEEVSPLSGLLGETSDGKTFEQCKFFIDDGEATSVNVSPFYNIKNTLKAKAAPLNALADKIPPDSRLPKITGLSTAAYISTQLTSVGTLVQACETNDAGGCNVSTISKTVGGFFLGAAGVLAAAFPPTAAVLGVFGVVADLFGIISDTSPSSNKLIQQAQEQGLLNEISKTVQLVVTTDLLANDIGVTARKVTSQLQIFAGFTQTNRMVLHEIQLQLQGQCVDCEIHIDNLIKNWVAQNFNSQTDQYLDFAENILVFIKTVGFDKTFDKFASWIESTLDDGDAKGVCNFPLYSVINECNEKVTQAATEWSDAIQNLPVYLSGVNAFVNYASIVVHIFSLHPSCAVIDENCLYLDAITQLWNTMRNSVTQKFIELQEAIKTMETCGPSTKCTDCVRPGAHPFNQVCSDQVCNFAYLTVSNIFPSDTEADDVSPSYFAKLAPTPLDTAAAFQVYTGTSTSDAASQFQSFVDNTGNPFTGGISTIGEPQCRFFPHTAEDNPAEDNPILLSDSYSTLYSGTAASCVQPQPPQQADCRKIVDYLEYVSLKGWGTPSYAIHALKGYSIYPGKGIGGDLGPPPTSLSQCLIASQNKKAFSPWEEVLPIVQSSEIAR